MSQLARTTLDLPLQADFSVVERVSPSLMSRTKKCNNRPLKSGSNMSRPAVGAYD
jgi:hypothetical protein